jgi:Skp family chaperone for outer membrane proteins
MSPKSPTPQIVAPSPLNQLPFELQRWNEACDRIMAMMERVVGFPQITVDTPATRRLAMEEMCVILCRHEQESRAISRKYEDLQSKYEQSNSTLADMQTRCSELNEELLRDRQMLTEHRNAAQRQGKTMIAEKLAHLEEMLQSQIIEHERLVSKRDRSHLTRHSVRPRQIVTRREHTSAKRRGLH